jgi:hypothetical protein
VGCFDRVLRHLEELMKIDIDWQRILEGWVLMEQKEKHD